MAGACLTSVAGCEPAAKPAAKPAAERAVKPVTATRDERAFASLSARADEAPRLGIGNLKRKDPEPGTAASDATVVEESKASSPLLQASRVASAASAAGAMSSEKAPVRENMSDGDEDIDARAN